MDVAAAADPTSRAPDPAATAAAAAAAATAVASPPAAPPQTAPADGSKAAAPPAGLPSLQPAPKREGPISDDVIKLFNAQQQNVEVSYRVEKDLGEVVTVFTDKTTGKTIVQFPSETLIALARLFDKIAGSVLDKKA